jgi:ATP-dependent RNA helicase RhlE
MLFNDLGLSAELLRAIDKKGYRQSTPIQQRAIPAILAGQDILACAQTGTGKTAGFTLPILQRLRKPKNGRKHVQVLILTPTRELAAQVAESVRDYGQFLPYSTAVIFGGVSINTQIQKLRNGVDIVVATPGRLLDHLERNTINLSAIEVLVLDEADRMLDMGFIRDIRKVMKALPKRRQNLLFSATFSSEIRRLANDLLNAPKEIEVAPRNSTADRVEQVVHPVDRPRKRKLLSNLISEGKWKQVLIFTRTKHGSNRLAEQLNRDGISAAAINGNKSQGARTRALKDFKSGDVRVLVATDIAARGLDIERLPHVVNYELPHVAEDYVHRIGRTARAGQSGHAISLVCADEVKLLKGIERLLGTDIARKTIAGFETDLTVGAVTNSERPKRGSGRRKSSQATGRHSAGGHTRGGPHKRSKQRKRRAS